MPFGWFISKKMYFVLFLDAGCWLLFLHNAYNLREMIKEYKIMRVLYSYMFFLEKARFRFSPLNQLTFVNKLFHLDKIHALICKQI